MLYPYHVRVGPDSAQEIGNKVAYPSTVAAEDISKGGAPLSGAIPDILIPVMPVGFLVDISQPARRAADRAGWGAAATGTLLVFCWYSLGILFVVC